MNKLLDAFEIANFQIKKTHKATIKFMDDVKSGCEDFKGIDLRFSALPGVDVHALNLSGGQLHGANLYGTSFVDCNLEGTNFEGANLYRVRFERCNLSKSLFYGSNLSRAQFLSVELSGAQFEGSRTITEAYFDEESFEALDLPLKVKTDVLETKWRQDNATEHARLHETISGSLETKIRSLWVEYLQARDPIYGKMGLF